MSNITLFGKFLRKIRIDNEQLLAEMAKSLNVSSAYLSSIENGVREIPDDFIAKISSVYNLNTAETMELRKAKVLTQGVTKISIGENSTSQKADTALLLADTFAQLNEEQITALHSLLEDFSKCNK